MKATELVLNFLKEQGFCPQIDENNNIVFKYQMRTFVFFNDDEDASFFQLAMPAIYDVTEENRGLVLETINKINIGYKVVKVGIVGESVWGSFEVLLDTTPNIEDIMPRALQMLMGAQQKFYSEIS